MRWAWGLLVAAAWSVAATATEAEVPVIENAGYALCVNEANDAMWVGRLARFFGRSRAEIEADTSLPPYMRAIVADYFHDGGEGRATDYVRFGLKRFRACLADQKVRFDAGDYQVYACLTRMDIPYFFQMLKEAGDTLEGATPKVQEALAGWKYPPALIPRMAAAAWGLETGRDVRDMQAFLFNACLLPTEQVTAYYNIPWTAPEKAGAAPSGGKAATPPGAGPAPAGKGAARP